MEYRFLFVLCAVLIAAAAPTALVAQDSRREAPGVSGAVSSTEIRREFDLVELAAKRAAADQLAAAWALVSAPLPDANLSGPFAPERIGWRAMSVAGMLRNQNQMAAADKFARHALAQSWGDLENGGSGRERAIAYYWRALLAGEVLDDRQQALTWLRDAQRHDPNLKRASAMQRKLEDAERSFPRKER